MLTLVTADLTSGLTPTDLAQSLVGPGITISNVKFTGNALAAGQFLNGFGDGLGIESGVMLGSGAIKNAVGPNNSTGITTVFGLPGDSDLDSLIPGFSTNDAVVLEFDFVATGGSLSFQYVFGSEEYNEFVGFPFNDVFGFFLDGQNIAFLPGTKTPVSINNVNLEQNSQFYRNNSTDDFGTVTPFPTQADGFTVVLQASAVAAAGTHHIKLALADAGDFQLDSWVFLGAQSFVSGDSDLQVEKIDSPDPVSLGDQLTYTLLITNNGPDPATAVLLQDSLPNGVTFVSAVASQGQVFETGGVVSAAPGTLASGASATVTITVIPQVLGKLVNTATVQAAQFDANLDNNSSTAETTVLRFNVSDITQLEGNSASKSFVFAITQPAGFTDTAVVTYTTVNQSATAGQDYTARAGTLTFAPGETQKLITVQVFGDTSVEGDEVFLVAVDHPPEKGTAIGFGKLINDDTGFGINDVTIVEGNSGQANMVFTVGTVGAAHQSPITVAYTTADATASAAADYLPRAGVLTFAPGITSLTITVPILSDVRNEDTEMFLVVLSNPTNAELVRNPGVGTIIDTDPLPVLYVNDVQITQNHSSALAAVFTVALDVPSGATVTVNYATSDGAAHAGLDYTAQSGVLTFPAGVTTMQVTVPVTTPGAYNANTAFFVNLTSPFRGRFGDPQGAATFVYSTPPEGRIIDDGDPAFSHSAGWTNLTNTLAYQLDYEYHTPGSGSGWAAWTFTDLPAGTYEVYAKWSQFGNRASNAPFTVYDGSTALGTTLVNQQLAPDDDYANAISWERIGTYNSSTGTLVVRVTDNANGYVIADAVRIVRGGIGLQAPEMDVSGFGYSFTTDDMTPSPDDATDFGAVSSTADYVYHTFTVRNNGNAPLHLTGTPRVTVAGANPDDFVVTAQPDFSVAPTGSTNFEVRFHPWGQGIRQAVISIANDDDSEHPYTFMVQGTGAIPVPVALHNAARPLDVNDDALVSPRDLLIVVNNLQQSDGPTASPLAAGDPTATPVAAATYYLDVTGDGIVSPRDALAIINYLLLQGSVPQAMPAAIPATAATDEDSDGALNAIAVDRAIGEGQQEGTSLVPRSDATAAAEEALNKQERTAAASVATAAVEACFAADEDSEADDAEEAWDADLVAL